MSKTNLPEIPVGPSDEAMVFEPPASFEVIDRGPAQAISFNHIGDTFVGIFESLETVTTEDDEMFPMATFTAANGKAYCIFPGWHLEKALKKVTPKHWVRITYNLDMDTGKPSPMKCFVVEIAK